MTAECSSQYPVAVCHGQVLVDKFPYHLSVPYHKPQFSHFTMKLRKMPSSKG